MKQTNSLTSRTLIFDIETDNLLLEVKNFWVGVIYCIEEKEYEVYYTADEMVQGLNKGTRLVGHNIIGYDIPVLNKLGVLNIEPTIELVDTLILGKLAYYNKDRSFSHSLDAYGTRLGEPKGEYSDWSKYTKEMETYCIQDVTVTHKLYKHLLRKTPWLPDKALQLEQDVQKIVTQQYIDGCEFDTRKGERLHVELLGEKEIAEEVLFKTFKPMFLPEGKVKEPKRPFRRLGVSTVGPHQPIKLLAFNPGSGRHIVWWISKLYGKQVWERTEKGQEKTDAENLKRMFEDKSWAKPLLHYLEVQKLLGQLAEGPKAWLKLEKGGRIHGQCDILGAVTGRFTHSQPNLAQVPSTRAYKGGDARSLFKAKSGYKIVGADASGLELRTLSHYLGRYDGGAYGQLVLNGDIHTANQQAAGLSTRDQAKTFIYAFLYGAGDGKIGSIVGGDSKKGSSLKRAFTTQVGGLAGLIADVKKAAKRKYLTGISGRRLHVRSPHSALNVLLQSCGAYYMKYYLVWVNKMLIEEKIDAKFILNVHDEIQMECREDQAKKLAKKLEEGFIIVGEEVGLRIKMEGEAKYGDTWKETH